MIISYNNLFFFRLYFIVILILLLYVSMALSNDIFKIIYKYWIYYRIDFNLFLNEQNMDIAINTYIKHKEWFVCISLLELILEKKMINCYLIYNFLAYCYKNMLFFESSNYYYQILLSEKQDDIYLLQNLADLHHSIGRKQQALNLYKRILLVDKNNIIAQNYINKNS